MRTFTRLNSPLAFRFTDVDGSVETYTLDLRCTTLSAQRDEIKQWLVEVPSSPIPAFFERRWTQLLEQVDTFLATHGDIYFEYYESGESRGRTRTNNSMRFYKRRVERFAQQVRELPDS